MSTAYTWSPFPMARTKRTWQIGLSTDEIEILMYPRSTDMVEGLSFANAIHLGLFDRADVEIRRAFWQKDTSGVPETVEIFTGKAGDVEICGNTVHLHVESLLALLDTGMPRNLYQTPCPNVLFDENCGLNRGSWDVSGTAASGSNKKTILLGGAAASKAAGWFTLGVVKFTSGVNDGVSRMIKRHVNGKLQIFPPLGTAPSAGDTLTLWPGCNKTAAICKTKFNNLEQHRGCPYIPVAETAA